MRKVTKLSNDTFWDLCVKLTEQMKADEGVKINKDTLLWGVPRGGVPVAFLLSGMLKCGLANNIEEAHIVVDDIVDTGTTRSNILCDYGDKPFFAVIDQSRMGEETKEWFVFPWEENEVGSKKDIIIRQLEVMGEDPHRNGLKDTPSRVVKMWEEIYSGYKQKPEDVLDVTFDNEENYDGMVVLRGVQFYSMCEHHMVPFSGKITLGYIPGKNGKVVGISKLARLVEIYTRRLQIQERLTMQIANAIDEHLSPAGVAVVVDAQHLCMKMRGVKQQGESTMRTAEMRGVFRASTAMRNEFMQGVV